MEQKFYKLEGARGLIKSRFCPSKFRPSGGFKFHALIGLGGNIGRTDRRFDRLALKFKKDRRLGLCEISPILLNRAFGYCDQADFLNAVAMLKTSLGARELLKILQHYEWRFGRRRSFKNAPRTLDLDILFFSRKTRDDSRLTLPHSGVNDRLSVLVPLGLMKI